MQHNSLYYNKVFFITINCNYNDRNNDNDTNNDEKLFLVGHFY